MTERISADMAEQPGLLVALAGRVSADWESDIQHAIGSPPVIAVVARGSSSHAVAIASNALEAAFAAPVLHVDVSVAARRASALPPGSVAIAVSQSGSTPDVLEAARRLHESGVTVLTVTNDRGPLADVGSAHIAVDAGRERSIPATKSILGQVAVLLTLAAQRLAIEEWSDLLALSAIWCKEELAAELPLSPEQLALDPVAAFGSGVGLGLAREFTQKVVETSGVPVLALDAAEFQHGPIAVARPGVSVFGFLLGQRDVVGQAMDKAVGRGADGIWVKASHAVTSSRDLPSELEQGLLALPVLVRLQRMMIGLALRRGFDPDEAFGLSKVTQTM